MAYDSCGLLQSPSLSSSPSSSPFDSYRSSAKIGASLTCYCTALLSAFELFAHESVDLLTRPQYPNPLRTPGHPSPLPPPHTHSPATQWLGFLLLLRLRLLYIYFILFFVLCVVFVVFACVFLPSPGKMQLTLCSRFSFSPMGVDLWQAVGASERHRDGEGREFHLFWTLLDAKSYACLRSVSDCKAPRVDLGLGS